jgi:hypothetical protein
MPEDFFLYRTQPLATENCLYTLGLNVTREEYESVIRFTGSSVFRKSFTFQNLVVHFELYDLEPDEEGIANFEVEYARFKQWPRSSARTAFRDC